MELTRKQVIDNLEKFVELRLLTSGFCETELFESLIYAISSLKTDEAYQIMYEGGEIFTKADMVAMLTEIQLEIKELNMHGSIQLQSYRQKTGRYRQGFERVQNLSTKIIQEKINALKEN